MSALKLEVHDQSFGLAGKAGSGLKIVYDLRLMVVGMACQVNGGIFISEPCIVFVTELGYNSNREHLRATNSRQVSKNVDFPTDTAIALAPKHISMPIDPGSTAVS